MLIIRGFYFIACSIQGLYSVYSILNPNWNNDLTLSSALVNIAITILVFIIAMLYTGNKSTRPVLSSASLTYLVTAFPSAYASYINDNVIALSFVGVGMIIIALLWFLMMIVRLR